jgi:hypothetical protein
LENNIKSLEKRVAESREKIWGICRYRKALQPLAASQKSPENGALPIMSFEETDYDFGTCAMRERSWNYTFKFTNTGKCAFADQQSNRYLRMHRASMA